MTGPSIPSINVADRDLRRILGALKQRVEAVDKAMASGMAAMRQSVDQQLVVIQQPAPPASGGSAPAEMALDELLLAPYPPPASVSSPPTGIPTGASLKWPCPAGNVPDGFLIEDGSTLDIADYPDLFAVIGTTWGGDGVTTFQLPPGEGYYPISAGPGLDVGDTVGANEIDLSHQHGPGDLAMADAGLHSHGAGSLATENAGDHTHEDGTLTTSSAGSHVHFAEVDTSGPATTVEVQSGTGVTVADGTHIHTTEGNVDAGGVHSHAVNGETALAGLHTHGITGSSADAGLHSHAINSGNTANALSATTDIRPLSAAVYWIIKT